MQKYDCTLTFPTVQYAFNVLHARLATKTVHSSLAMGTHKATDVLIWGELSAVGERLHRSAPTSSSRGWANWVGESMIKRYCSVVVTFVELESLCFESTPAWL